MEETPKKSHEGDGASDLDGHQDEADSTELENVAQKKSRAEQDDARLEPELVGGHAAAEDFRNADRVGDNQAEDDGPQDVFDTGKRPVMGLRVGADVLLQQFARVADGGEQNHTGDNAQKSQHRLNRPDLRDRDDIRHDSSSPFSESSHQGTCLKTPTRTNRAARKATSTAQASRDNLQPFPFLTAFASPLICILLTAQITDAWCETRSF